VRIERDAPASSGFACGDAVHAYGPDEAGDLSLCMLARDEALARFEAAENAVTWGVSESSGRAALLAVRTPAGGDITVMDLRAADRAPEPSGAETPATQILLNGLGFGTAVFGKFVCAYRRYDEFVGAAASLAAAHPKLATLERIGVSAAGLPLWVLKIGKAALRSPVLMSCGIHPLEWAPAYGVLRYARFLLRQCAAGTPYARAALGERQLWWVLCACPDGWETRDQQVSGVNLNRNFPGSWEHCVPGARIWDSYNRRFGPGDADPFVARGPAAGSQPEARALMGLLDAAGGAAAMADFHETTAPDSFIHQHEEPDGTIADLAYHRELVEGVAGVFSGRFYGHTNLVAYRPALTDFDTYRPRLFESLARLVPGAQSGWQQYAAARGARAVVVESAGSDCTHYHTIRRTEYAALVAEQVLFAQEGRIVRNPFGVERVFSLRLHRRPGRVHCRVYDAADQPVEEHRIETPTACECRVPGNGWARLEASG
jgi:hypothetical protein